MKYIKGMIFPYADGPPRDKPVAMAVPPRAGRSRPRFHTVAANVLMAAGVAFMAGACELPSSFEELGRVLDGEGEAEAAKDAPGQAETDPDAKAQAAGQDTAARAEPTREMVLTAQTRLAELGYEPGPIDGLYGPKTRRAIRSFQADAGLPPDGRISKALIERLSEGDSEKTGPSAAAKPRPRPERMPAYDVGDTFIYSDGRIETVTAVEGDKVRWQGDDGTVFTTYANFILPPIERQTGLLNATTTLSTEPDALWPLEVGREVSFTAMTEFAHKGQPEESNRHTSQWHCAVEGNETVSVAAGTFDTVRVACRTSASSPGGLAERIWYYAPRVRHYVRRDDRLGSGDREKRVELVAIQIAGGTWPSAARAGLGWALQQALETKSQKESIEWGSSGVDVKISIKPTASLNTSGTPYCRTFEQTVRHARGQRVYPGKACRDASGQWAIPGLDNLTQAAKKNS